MRDSFIVAAAHIARLTDPDQVKAWLYALARVECLRRRASPASEPGVESSPQQEPDPTLLAWHAVMNLSPLEREVLELSFGQNLDPAGVASVLGITAREADSLLAMASESVDQALAGEVLGRMGGGDCPPREAIVAARAGHSRHPCASKQAGAAGQATVTGLARET